MTTALPLHIKDRSVRLLALLAALALFVSAPGAPKTVTTVAAINDSLASYLASHSPAIVPVIVETRGDSAAVEAEITAGGGHVGQRLHAIHGFMATVSPALADRLNHDPRVLRINLDAPVRWLGNVDSSQLVNRYEGYSQVQSGWKSGLDGSGIKTAVIDTGAWPHNDLVQASPYVPGNVGNRLLTLTTNPNATDSLDHYGHGTHVAGILAGNGYDSHGQYIGVAPNSLVVSVKVSDDLGNANEGDVITGLDWVYQANQHGMGIRVINLSVTSTVAQSYHQSALDAEVERLWNSGVVVVVAAGNNPNGGSVVYAPGNDPFVITVGSLEDNYQTNPALATMASWALYGTTQDGFAKPDVVADGSHVVSLLAPGSLLSSQHPTNIQAPSAPTYFKMGGTSMAAPQVAGMAAQMLQYAPSLTNGQVKSVLKGTTDPFSTTSYTQRLGANGGLADVKILGWVPGPDDNAGTQHSNAYDPVANTILAGGAWWGSATWSANVSWNSVAWNSVAWNASDFASVSWSDLNSPNPVQNATAYWSSVAWNSVAWNSVAWNSVAWNSVAWNSVAWNSVAWNSGEWQ